MMTLKNGLFKEKDTLSLCGAELMELFI